MKRSRKEKVDLKRNWKQVATSCEMRQTV